MHPSGLFGTSQLVDVGAARQVIVEPAGGRPSRKPLPTSDVAALRVDLHCMYGSS